jgi:dethiobiotin synthetase
MNGLFFTGTDTGVGKTFITAAVARHLRRHSHVVRVSKPVATGAQRKDGRWLCDDTLRLTEAAGPGNEPEDVTPWAFPDAVAPPVAARRQGVSLDVPSLAAAARRRAAGGTILLVEGVGGLLCPLTERETVADLVRALGLPLVVVARRSLGTLNHTLLTLETARARGLRLAGVVVSETSPSRDLADKTNVEELRRRINIPLLTVVPYRPGVDDADLPEITAVDWRRLSTP